MSDEMTGAATCREAVDLVVERIWRACDDVGGGQGAFVTEEDVVRCVIGWIWRVWMGADLHFSFSSVAEAQRITSMYAKMEYGVKRLLWLGG